MASGPSTIFVGGLSGCIPRFFGVQPHHQPPPPTLELTQPLLRSISIVSPYTMLGGSTSVDSDLESGVVIYNSDFENEKAEKLRLLEEEERESREVIIEDEIFESLDDGMIEEGAGSISEDADGAPESGVLFEYLRSLVEKVKTEIHSNSQPVCYKTGTFWIRPWDSVFAVDNSFHSSEKAEPTQLYYPDVFVWLLGLKAQLPGEPQTLRCPASNRGGELKRSGYFTDPPARRIC
ncbi:hypothetical protein JAAARDRAFT_201452 [Jaapia argillacea MUCL 33604]|uniref:Uncharacterized protein n=1 Tax=Jaapia argillacea MUCL 33604 TaxID=933084 RepID=A0A067QAB2_9AGAM|nr:hypothetical protein JAAARDRAFT_201452 [Jaapia argillacea MUCL 33604]